jgi:DNA replication protein DnaC
LEWIIDEKTNTARPCKCREVKAYKRILKSSGISEAFRRKSFDNFKINNPLTAQAKKMAINYVRYFSRIKDQRNNSIAFLGQVGAGKTHLSIAIANELMKQNVGVLYMQYREAITHLKQNMLDEEYYQKEMCKYKTASVLLIDDLYKGKITDSDLNIMFEIINYRYLKQLPIIVSSEYTVDKLLNFDEAIGSRIIEMCKKHIIEFHGQELNYRINGR